MDLLREHNVFFGASVTYTAQNIDATASDEFVEMLIEKLEAGLSWIYQHCYSWRSIIRRTTLRFKPLIWTVNRIYHHRVRGWIAREASLATPQ